MTTRLTRAVLLFAAFLVGACASNGGGDPGGCQTDNDCKGVRICVSNACVDPGGAPSDLAVGAVVDLKGAPVVDFAGAPPGSDLSTTPAVVDMATAPVFDLASPPILDFALNPPDLVATCADNLANGQESDVDCGGNVCPHCINGKHCNGNGDCTSGYCEANVCKPMPTCNDGIKNQDESDIDCGGQFCPRCANGRACMGNNDCQNNICSGGTCRPPANCNDNIRNQDETDVDCGGQICGKCVDGKSCNVNNDCQSGSCNNGVCGPMPPVALAQNISRIHDIAIDANTVYWVEDNNPGALRSVPKGGGGVVTLNGNLLGPSAVIVDGSNAYVLEYNNGVGRISMVALNGGATQTIVSGLHNAQNFLAQDGNNIYFGDGVQGGGGAIKKVPKAANQNPVTLTSGCNNPPGLCNLHPPVDTDGASVFFANDFGRIVTVANGGGNSSVVGVGNAWALRQNGNFIYFVDGQAGTVNAMQKAGGAVQVLSNAAPNVADLATDGSYVYWIQQNNQPGVARVSVNGGQVKTYSNSGNSLGIEVDGTYVFWGESQFGGGAKIMRALK